MVKILLVEDNETITRDLKYSLEQEKFEVDTAENIVMAKAKIKKQKYNLYLLDIALPDGDGYEIYQYVKSIEDTPVIFLTAKDEELDVVQGLDMGADDYVIKPFRIRELISRIKIVLRRYYHEESEENQIKCGNIIIDDNKAEVYQEKQEFIHEISRQVEWINWLVISLLKLSKLESGTAIFRKEKIDVKKLVDNVVRNFAIPLDIKQQKINISDNKNDVFIVGDYNWQLEALTNIVKNCIEHTPENKNIYGATFEIKYTNDMTDF